MPFMRQELDIERVTALRSGPLEDVPDLEAAKAIVRLAYSELEAFGTGGAANVDDEGSEELLPCLKAGRSRVCLTSDVPDL
jgi:hypothetical protein